MDKLSQVSVFLALLIALFSARPWFIWGHSYIELAILFFFIITRLLLMKKSIMRRDIMPTVFCLFLFLFIYVVNAPDISTAFSQICTKLIPLALFIQFTNKEKKRFIDSFTTVFSLILFVSLIFFTLFQFGVSLPFSRISHSDAHYSEFYNYYAFIVDGHLGIFTRFRSVFTEPGHVGMFASIILYVNDYKLPKWKLFPLLITIIWSFSLAAYFLLIIGYVLYLLLNNRFRVYLLLIPIILLLSAWAISLYYKNNKGSLVSELIISRLQITNDGKLSGNNRHTSDFLTYYDKFDKTSDYITGLGSHKYHKLPFLSGNASYKNFILEHGLMGILFLMFFGLSFIYSYASLQYFGLFLLYVAAFLQRPYALWEVESFLYIAYSCQVLDKKYIIKSDCRLNTNSITNLIK